MAVLGVSRRRAAAVAWTVAIFAACSIPGDALPRAPIVSADKIVHVVMFAVFAVLWIRAAPGRGWTILAAAVAFAVGIEVWQQLPLVGRTADPWDAVADVLGAALGLGGWSARRARRQRSAG